ncbi:hypothetical protein [Portibacter marinus]|uniref:hypothetical protein n=1 Tax=Portibacter marinus TaxID=2898660 RepID=UPI001F253AB4|nr:hypothetical protein [Portibacter marinus]
MESEINFMDEPKPDLRKSFRENEYYQNMTRHLNSFLFIIKSLAENKSEIEIEKQLELNILEYAERLKR